MNQTKTYRVVRLTAENVKRLKAVTIEPSGNVVTVGGINGAGKSSVLDAIMYALAGKGAQPKVPVRAGQESAHIECDLGAFVVRRTIRDDGKSELVITSKDGGIYPRPQTMLDALTGEIAFDPLAFSRMTAAEQYTAAAKIMGIDLTGLDMAEKELMDKRRLAKRDAAAAGTRLQAALVATIGLERTMPANMSSLMRELEKEELKQFKRNELETAHDDTTKEMQRLRNMIDAAQAKLEQLIQVEDAQRKELDEAPRGNVIGVKEKLSKAEGINVIAGKFNELDLAHEDLEEKETIVSDAEEALRVARADRAEMIAGADIPIQGLSLADGAVTYAGLPFDQASSAEQLRVSVAMGLAANPGIRVLLIRDGSLLDADSLDMVADMAAKHDAQVWIERVGEGAECQVIIEDGMVRP